MYNKFNVDYHAGFCDEVVRLGLEGKSETQMAASLGVSLKKFNSWIKNPNIPEFKEAVMLAMTYALAYHEDVLTKIARGILPRGNSTSQQFLMKIRFQDKYKETSESKVDFTNTTKNLTDKELDEMIAALVARKGQGQSNSGAPAQVSV
jgi:hypothetical protein